MIWRITMQIEGCVICQGWTINLLLQWQNQNITEIFSLTSTLFSSNSSCHQPSSHSFAIRAMFFFFFAKHEDFYFIFSSSTKTAGLMQPCPQSFSIALVFSRDILHLTDIFSLDITNVFKIWSMVSWIWRISQEICAIRVGEIFWINSNKGVIPFLVRNSDFIIFVINLLEKHV